MEDTSIMLICHLEEQTYHLQYSLRENEYEEENY